MSFSFTRVSEGKQCPEIKVHIVSLSQYHYNNAPRSSHTKWQNTFAASSRDITWEQPTSSCNDWPHSTRNLRLIFTKID
jgi:hypothetical protein